MNVTTNHALKTSNFFKGHISIQNYKSYFNKYWLFSHDTLWQMATLAQPACDALFYKSPEVRMLSRFLHATFAAYVTCSLSILTSRCPCMTHQQHAQTTSATKVPHQKLPLCVSTPQGILFAQNEQFSTVKSQIDTLFLSFYWVVVARYLVWWTLFS